MIWRPTASLQIINFRKKVIELNSVCECGGIVTRTASKMTSLFASTPATQETASLFINEKFASARTKVSILLATQQIAYKHKHILTLADFRIHRLSIGWMNVMLADLNQLKDVKRSKKFRSWSCIRTKSYWRSFWRIFYHLATIPCRKSSVALYLSSKKYRTYYFVGNVTRVFPRIGIQHFIENLPLTF